MKPIQGQHPTTGPTTLQRVEMGRRLGRIFADGLEVSATVSDTVCAAMEFACPFMRHGFNQVMKQRGLDIRAVSESEAPRLAAQGWSDHRQPIARLHRGALT